MASVAAAAAGAVLVADGCSSPGGGVNVGPAALPGAQYTLRVGYTNSTIQGYRFRTRTYNGSTIGPTLYTQPGSTLSVNVVNMLPPDAVATIPQGAICMPASFGEARHMMAAAGARIGPQAAGTLDLMNNPHSFNTTNLHVHGVQTVPHLFNPIGTSDALAPMIAIGPGQSFRYDFPIAPNQPSGLYWFHPHHHGSTDVQVAGGMAGLIVIRGPIDAVPEIAAARDIHLAIQTINVNKSTSDPNLYVYEPVAYQPPPPAGNGYSLGTNFAMTTVNGQGVNWVDNTLNTGGAVPGVYKAFAPPQIQMQPGEVVRLRILNGANFMIYPLVLPGMDVFIIGRDGVNLLEPQYVAQSNTTLVTPANLYDGTTMLAAPGTRFELLVRAPKNPGVYTLRAVATDGVSFQAFPSFDFAQFVVGGSAVSMAIPQALPPPTREYPLIADSEINQTHSVTFSEGPTNTLLTGFGFFLNGKAYDHTSIDAYPSLGGAGEWTLMNTSAEAHPFHIHVNSFEVVSINGVPLPVPAIGDVVLIPPAGANGPGSIKIRTRFQQWKGKSVFHCHILPHEDTGMMQNIIIA